MPQISSLFGGLCKHSRSSSANPNWLKAMGKRIVRNPSTISKVLMMITKLCQISSHIVPTFHSKLHTQCLCLCVFVSCDTFSGKVRRHVMCAAFQETSRFLWLKFCNLSIILSFEQAILLQYGKKSNTYNDEFKLLILEK